MRGGHRFFACVGIAVFAQHAGQNGDIIEQFMVGKARFFVRGPQLGMGLGQSSGIGGLGQHRCVRSQFGAVFGKAVIRRTQRCGDLLKLFGRCDVFRVPTIMLCRPDSMFCCLIGRGDRLGLRQNGGAEHQAKAHCGNK